MSYADILKKKAKEWNCPDMMDSCKRIVPRIPFSSPFPNYSTYGGIPRNQITEFYGEPGGGKAQPLYSKVLTPEGFRAMGSLQIGDEVFDGSGNRCKVIGVYPQGLKDVYEITTQGKNKIRVASGHLNEVWWWDTDHHCKQRRTWTTEELLYEFQNHKSRKYRIDIPEVDWPERPVKIDPYLLGALIGDGSLSDDSLGFSNPEKDVLEKVNSKLAYYGMCLKNYARNGIDWSIAYMDYVPSTVTSKLKQALKELHLNVKCYDKHIPKEYLFNSREVRLELLRGLMDTDGCINNAANGKDRAVEFSTSSDQLSEDFAFLVRSLGIRDTINPSVGKYRDKNGNKIECHVTYQHLLKIPNDLVFYSSEKHKKRFLPRQNPPMRNIVSIEYVGKEECQCIMVDSPEHTYISDDFIPTHNTSSAIDVSHNAVSLFRQEYEEEVERLRGLVGAGKKEYDGPLQDLLESGPKRVLYVDLEHSFDFRWASKMGVNEGDIDVMQPPDIPGEDILNVVMEIIQTGEVGLVVLDSIPSLVPKAELEKKLGERTVAALAGLMTIFLRKVVPLLTRYGCTLILINQTRPNMDNPYVINTPGGEAIKFYSVLRMYFRQGAPVDFAGNELPKSVEDPKGYVITVKITKQKSAPNDRKLASYFLMADSGIRPDFDYAKLAIDKYGIIKKSGAWFTLCNPETGEILEEDGKPVKVNGIVKCYEYLQSHPDYYDSIRKYITADIESTGTGSDTNSEGGI